MNKSRNKDLWYALDVCLWAYFSYYSWKVTKKWTPCFFVPLLLSQWIVSDVFSHKMNVQTIWHMSVNILYLIIRYTLSFLFEYT